MKIDSEQSSNERIVTLSGTKAAVVQAHLLIAEIVAAMPPENVLQTSKRQMTAQPAYALPASLSPYNGRSAGVPSYPPFTQPAYSALPGAPGYAPQQHPFMGTQPPGLPAGFSAAGGFAQQPFATQSFAQQAAHTAEQLVSQDQAGRLIGKGGQSIKELRDMSKAMIKVETECQPGTEMRKIVVSGTAEAVQVALSLIHQRIAEMNRP